MPRGSCRAPAVAFVIFLLTACAPLSPEQRQVPRPSRSEPLTAHPVAAWPLQDLAVTDGPAVALNRDGTTVAMLSTRVLHALQSAVRRINSVASLDAPRLKPEFQLVEGRSANAFAILTAAEPVIAVNFGMLSLIGEDEAMWAAVLGHELAHLKCGHQLQRAERSEFNEAASGLLSVVLSFTGLPFAPLLTDGAAAMVTLGYSRSDELEADALSVTYLRQAGYDPAAALRFHERLAERSGNDSGGLLSTHPGGAARVEAIRRQLAGGFTR